jgi:uncharacterized membrane protein YhaH (DUF805 family)
MTIAQKLFSFRGRLRRRDAWLLLILLAVLNLILAAAGMALMGSSLLPSTLGRATDLDQDQWIALRRQVQAVAFAIILWPWLAIAIKRMHDRNRTGWWLALFFVPLGIQQLLGATYLRFGLGLYAPNHVGVVLGLRALMLVWALIFLWLSIEMGFLDGTRGPNRFGPSPKGIGSDSLATSGV